MAKMQIQKGLFDLEFKDKILLQHVLIKVLHIFEFDKKGFFLQTFHDLFLAIFLIE